MALVYSYVRFSTRKQLDGDSLRRQVEMGDAWIARNGHTLAAITLHDIGKSGYHASNLKSPDGKLAAFLRMIEEGRVKPGDILLVENLDRLSREGMRPAQALFERIIGAGVKIAVLKPYERVFDTKALETPFELLEPLMAFHLAFIESKNKADRLRAKWDKKRADAAAQGAAFKFDRRGPSWLTWNKDTGGFVVNAGADAIRFIYEATATGVGQRRLLRMLTEKFTPIGTSKQWNGSFIAAVLNDKSVLGIRQPKTSVNGKRIAIGAEIAGYYPPIITEELWTRTQAAKAANTKHKGPNGKFVNLLTGLVFSAVDGQPMHLQTTQGTATKLQRRLVSYGHWRKIASSDPVTVMYEPLEAMLLSHVSEIRAEDLNSNLNVSDLRAKEQELAGVENRLRRIEKDLADADDEEYATLRAASKNARAKRAELIAAVTKIKTEIDADKPLVQAHEVMASLHAVQGDELHLLRLRLRSLLAELIESVLIRSEKHLGRIYSMIQVNYRNGLVRQFGYGPGWVSKHSGAAEAPPCMLFNFDLRNRKACQKVRLAKMAAHLHQAPPAPTVKAIPATLGEAASLFLAVRRSEMAAQSFRAVPPRIRRFVEYIGGDTPVSDLERRHWSLFQRWLKQEVREGRLENTTARVGRNRVRELLEWLVAAGAVEEIDFGGSAAKEI